MVTNEYNELLNDSKPIRSYYVYGWVCSDWGGVYFYVGKGCKDRYKSLSNRSMTFMSIVKRWNCFPVILEDDLTEEEAFAEEDRIKQTFLFENGYPLLDGEGCHSLVKNLAIKRAKAIAREKGVRVDGRPKLKVSREKFSELFEEQQKGGITVGDACALLGISRSSWYNLVRAKECSGGM